MKFTIFILLILVFALDTTGQGFSKEDITKHKIKKIFTDGPKSRYYSIDEYDTLGNLVKVSHVYDSMPAFVEEELRYNSSMLLIEKRKHRNYDTGTLEIIQYFYNEQGLLVRDEDTIICKLCKIPKRIKSYEYNDSNQLIIEKYQSGDFYTLEKHYYNDKGLRVKTVASVDNEKDFIHFYFYDDKRNLIKDSVFNFMSKGKLRNFYNYDDNGRLREAKNMGIKTLYSQTWFIYDDEGLLTRIKSKQKGCETKEYYTSETYFNFEKY